MASLFTFKAPKGKLLAVKCCKMPIRCINCGKCRKKLSKERLFWVIDNDWRLIATVLLLCGAHLCVFHLCLKLITITRDAPSKIKNRRQELLQQQQEPLTFPQGFFQHLILVVTFKFHDIVRYQKNQCRRFVWSNLKINSLKTFKKKKIELMSRCVRISAVTGEGQTGVYYPSHREREICFPPPPLIDQISQERPTIVIFFFTPFFWSTCTWK